MSTAAQLDAVIAEVRRAYVLGGIKIGLNPDAAQLLLSRGLEALGVDLFRRPEFAATVRNYAQLRTRVEGWATVYRRWALNGRRDDGSAYTVARFLDYGRELGDAIRYQTGIAWDSSRLGVLAGTAAQTAADVANLPELIPGWVPWAAGVVVVVVLVAVFR